MNNQKSPKSQYVDNKKLLEELKIYRQKVADAVALKQEKPILSNFIGKCIADIAEHLSTMPMFKGYSFRSEMVADGIENSIMYIDNFDPEKSEKPFAYLTKIIYYAFLRRIAKEKKQLYIKYKLVVSHGLMNPGTHRDVGAAESQIETYDNIVRYVEEYETKQDEKQKIKKAKQQAIKEKLDVFFGEDAHT